MTPATKSPNYIRTKQFTPNTMLALRETINGIGTEMALYKELKAVPQDKVRNFRNDMYVVSEALRLMNKTHQPAFSTADTAILANYKKHIDNATKFIPTWVKVAVALALGMGTMIGWKRIVVTVGEKIGKDHLTYASRRSRRNHGDGHDRRRRLVRLTCQYHARALFRRRRNHGRKSLRIANEHSPQSGVGVGADAARLDLSGGQLCSGHSAKSASSKRFELGLTL